MNEDLCKAAVDVALSLGAEYAEARIQRNADQIAILRNGLPEPSIIVDVKGIGIRLIYGGALAFAATNSLDDGSVKEMVEGAVKRAKSSALILKKKVGLSSERSSQAKWGAEEKKSLDDISIDELLRVLRELDIPIRDGRNGVQFPNRLLFLRTMIEEKRYVNSDGADLESRVPRVQFNSILAAKHDGAISTITIPAGYAQLGQSGGWEVLDRLDLFNNIPREADEMSLAVQATEGPPDGDIDIVLGPEVAGLVAHESSGHPEEADRILGREAAQAGESYLASTDIGMRIGGDEAYVSDDPTLSRSMGFYEFDDEGVRARKRRLITGGTISELLHNRETARELGTRSNGAARAMQYDREPIIRMANTYIEPGDYTFDELVRDVKLGVYIKSFMEWNIDDKRLNQRYVGLEAFLIERGEVRGAVKDPVLEVTTPKFWSSIDARGNDLSFTAATCGKGDPMQGAPVWTGGPHLRLRGIRVGSR